MERQGCAAAGRSPGSGQTGRATLATSRPRGASDARFNRWPSAAIVPSLLAVQEPQRAPPASARAWPRAAGRSSSTCDCSPRPGRSSWRTSPCRAPPSSCAARHLSTTMSRADVGSPRNTPPLGDVASRRCCDPSIRRTNAGTSNNGPCRAVSVPPCGWPRTWPVALEHASGRRIKSSGAHPERPPVPPKTAVWRDAWRTRACRRPGRAMQCRPNASPGLYHGRLRC